MTRIEAVLKMLKNEQTYTNQMIQRLQEQEKYLYGLIDKVEKIQEDKHLQDTEAQP